jgi:hypothetical protein
MHYRSVVLMLLALSATLSGCVLGNAYDRTASKLAESLYEWRAPGDDTLTAPTPEVSARIRLALHQCIDNLSKEPPEMGSSREARTVELVDCMKLKGWT